MYSFTYNDEGIRTSKTKGGVTTTYYLEGSTIVAEETNDNLTVYIYDSSGMPVGMQYCANSSTSTSWDVYWFERNLQGDIVAVYSSEGTKLVQYKYDAWGNISTTYYSGGASTTATKNPFRYRGYYYDVDLGLYYLNTRYYDANTGRFISPDAVDVVCATPNALTDKNLYAYCDNNPVMRRDDGGQFWDTLFDVVSLAFSVADVVATPANPWAWAGLVGDVVDLIPFVSGVGEATDLLRVATKADEFADAVDDIHDTAKAIDKAKDTIKASERSSAVRKAWKLEYENVSNGGTGISRTWSKCEMDELLTNGKIKGYQGHHMKSVKGYPHLASDPNNIQFLTRAEHLRAHGGNFRNITHGRFRIGD